MKNALIGVLMDDSTCLTFVEVCERCHVPEAWLLDVLEHGLFHDKGVPSTNMTFHYTMLPRLQAALRLQRDLELNVSGVVLAMELLEKIDALNAKLTVLQRQVA